MLAQRGVSKLAPDQCGERVVLALGVGAGVIVLGGLDGFAGDGGALVVGVAHPGRGEGGQPGFQHGPQFGGGDQAGDAHAVGALASAPLETALGGAVVLGECSIGVERGGQAVGDFRQLVGAQFGGFLGQERFGLLDLGGVDVLGQVADEVLDGA